MAIADRVILASGSSGRLQLLRRAGFDPIVMPSTAPEPEPVGVTDPAAFVHTAAWGKAANVARRVDSGLIIAADSIAWLDRQVIGKPADRDDARRILRWLSGSTHELWTGVCLWKRPENWQFCWQERSVVAMKPMTEAQLEAYLDTDQWQGKSGAYAIQEQNDPFITVVEGSVSNVVGLPMENLLRYLPRLPRDR